MTALTAEEEAKLIAEARQRLVESGEMKRAMCNIALLRGVADEALKRTSSKQRRALIESSLAWIIKSYDKIARELEADELSVFDIWLAVGQLTNAAIMFGESTHSLPQVVSARIASEAGKAKAAKRTDDIDEAVTAMCAELGYIPRRSDAAIRGTLPALHEHQLRLHKERGGKGKPRFVRDIKKIRASLGRMTPAA